jgi:large subunit ribosomal protein L6
MISTLAKNTLKTANQTYLRGFSTASAQLSHIGKASLYYSSDVTISLLNETSQNNLKYGEAKMLSVKGPLGEQRVPIVPFVKLDFLKEITESGNHELKITVEDANIKHQKAMWGTTRALISNCIEGVTEGFTISLRMSGVGYRAMLEGNTIGLKCGYSHPINEPIPEGIQVKIPNPTKIIMTSIDKQKLMAFATKVRKWKKPEPYNGKGIFIGDEVVRRKEGKKK